VPCPQLEEHITCEICTLRLWFPYMYVGTLLALIISAIYNEPQTSFAFVHSLPGCGHTFCQSCLQDWFSTNLSNHRHDFPTYNQNQYHQPQPQYTCPTCRQVVRAKPAEDFVLKAIVRTLASGSGERSPKKYSSPTRTGVGAAKGGPWDVFFRGSAQ